MAPCDGGIHMEISEVHIPCCFLNVPTAQLQTHGGLNIEVFRKTNHYTPISHLHPHFNHLYHFKVSVTLLNHHLTLKTNELSTMLNPENLGL